VTKKLAFREQEAPESLKLWNLPILATDLLTWVTKHLFSWNKADIVMV